MARNTRPTAAKREREKSLIERRQQKEARRRELIKDRPDGGLTHDGIDPDIAGIVPGPQPLADWQIPDEEEEEAPS